MLLTCLFCSFYHSHSCFYRHLSLIMSTVHVIYHCYLLRKLFLGSKVRYQARSCVCQTAHSSVTDKQACRVETVMEVDSLLPLPRSRTKRTWRRTHAQCWRTDWCPWLPSRYVLALMGFLGFVNVFVLRVNLSMALVVMVNDSRSNIREQPRPVSYEC